MATEKHARYMQDSKTKKVSLVAADDQDDSKYEEPTGYKSNGEQWNTDENEGQRDAAIQCQKATDEAKAKRDAQKAKDDEKARADAEKASAQAEKDNPPKPDFTVAVVKP